MPAVVLSGPTTPVQDLVVISSISCHDMYSYLQKVEVAVFHAQGETIATGDEQVR